ncbi:MAG: Gfo/Idh/MocA family oxidoreductase [Ruminococcaceae bacterium]|nr:Gfo/Idh/MocA family oxidoreductase [Oscillospiraceae bacterium]
MIKLGLIGFGGMGEVHANCYKKMPDLVQVTAIADLRAERRDRGEELLGAKVYESAQELLDNAELDAVDICLPTYLHAEYAIKAMEKGLAVFVEKPVCINSAEGEQMLEAQKRTGATLQVGHVIRFWDEYMYLKQVKDSGIYGKLLSGSFYRLSANPDCGWENWFNDPQKSGSAALDLHIHDADFIRYLMGEPDGLETVARRCDNGVISGITAKYYYGDTQIVAEGAWDFPKSFPFRMEFIVRFEGATVAYEQKKLVVYPVNGEAFTPEFSVMAADEKKDSGISVPGGDGYERELRYFVEHLSGGEEIAVATLPDSVESVRLVEKEMNLAGGIIK